MDVASNCATISVTRAGSLEMRRVYVLVANGGEDILEGVHVYRCVVRAVVVFGMRLRMSHNLYTTISGGYVDRAIFMVTETIGVPESESGGYMLLFLAAPEAGLVRSKGCLRGGGNY